MTNATSGNALTVFSTSNCMVCDWLSAVLGIRMACMRDVLLIERRDELLAEPREQKQRRHEQHQRQRQITEQRASDRSRSTGA